MLLAILWSGCVAPHAWMIERNEYGGVIGYKKGNMHLWGEQEQQERLLAKAIDDEASSICGSSRWRVVRERVQEREYTYYTQQAVTTTSKSDVKLRSQTRYSYSQPPLETNTQGTVNSSSTTYVPVQRTGVEVWWEATIACRGFSSSSSVPVGSTSTVTPVKRSSNPPKQTTSESTTSQCSAADLSEMRSAGLSESAIASACSP